MYGRKKIATSITISVEVFNKVQRHLETCLQCRSFSEAIEHLAKVGHARLLEFQEGGGR